MNAALCFTAGVLVGMALAAFAALALAYYLDRREQMASMRRHSAMTAALSGMGTPRSKVVEVHLDSNGRGQVDDVFRPDVSHYSLRINGNGVRPAVLDKAIFHFDAGAGGIVGGPVRGVVGDNGPEAIVPLRPPYLPESRDADFQP